jgi:hypothetical protein
MATVKKKKYKETIILIAILFILITVLLTFRLPKPPVKEFESYHHAMMEARKSLAHYYAPETFAMAEHFRNKAFLNWREENKKLIFLRDYEESKRMILIALSLAEKAEETAKNSDTGINHVPANEKKSAGISEEQLQQKNDRIQ